METHDILLGGQGYMVAPGSYRRGAEGGSPATRRVVQRAWSGGGLQPLQAGDDRFWSSLGLLPASSEGGVGPGPKETAFAIAGLHPTARRHAALHGGRPYFATGGGLYRPDRAGAGLNPNNLGGFTQLGPAFAGDCNGLASDGGTRLYLSRDGQPFMTWTIGGASFDTTPTLQLTGCAWYAGSLWGGLFDGTLWRLVRCTGGSAYEGSGWPIDSAPRTFAALRDGLYFGTGGALWRARGTVIGGAFSGEITPQASGGGTDDFVALAEYNGDLYTWHNGAVVRHGVSPTGRTELAPAGLRGFACRGLAVAGGYLFAALSDTPGGSGVGLWAYDGRGWWCLGRNADGNHDYSWPLATASYLDNADLIVFGGGTTLYGLQLRPRTAQPGIAPGGELTTALWHAASPDGDKAWTRIGAELAWPGGATFGSCTVALAYSADGATFTTAGSAGVSGAAPRTLAFALPANTVGKWLALRYTLGGVTTGGPVLAALWAEYRPAEPGARRRTWQFDLLAADATPRRDGAPDPRAGGAISADLWAAWESGATLTFRDLDYDRLPTQRTVRIIALDETIPAPADAGRWGESRLRVKLIEL
jgi:hypothetical protein